MYVNIFAILKLYVDMYGCDITKTDCYSHDGNLILPVLFEQCSTQLSADHAAPATQG